MKYLLMYRLYDPVRHYRRHDAADQQTGHQTDSEHHQPDFQAMQNLIIQIHFSGLRHIVWIYTISLSASSSWLVDAAAPTEVTLSTDLRFPPPWPYQ